MKEEGLKEMIDKYESKLELLSKVTITTDTYDTGRLAKRFLTSFLHDLNRLKTKAEEPKIETE
jgi:predicted DNA-binding protein YlxM (UPF0122 family)